MIRDDLYRDEEYALRANHDEAHGKAIRKKIWFVTALLSIITIVEVAIGIMFPKTEVSAGAFEAIKYGYIILTLIKAGYIVMVFMHLGDERKNFKWFVLGPYIVFIIYLIFIVITEANYVLETGRAML